jgi:hypothetical protein
MQLVKTIKIEILASQTFTVMLQPDDFDILCKNMRVLQEYPMERYCNATVILLSWYCFSNGCLSFQ